MRNGSALSKVCLADQRDNAAFLSEGRYVANVVDGNVTL